MENETFEWKTERSNWKRNVWTENGTFKRKIEHLNEKRNVQTERLKEKRDIWLENEPFKPKTERLEQIWNVWIKYGIYIDLAIHNSIQTFSHNTILVLTIYIHSDS